MCVCVCARVCVCVCVCGGICVCAAMLATRTVSWLHVLRIGRNIARVRRCVAPDCAADMGSYSGCGTMAYRASRALAHAANRSACAARCSWLAVIDVPLCTAHASCIHRSKRSPHRCLQAGSNEHCTARAHIAKHTRAAYAHVCVYQGRVGA